MTAGSLSFEPGPESYRTAAYAYDLPPGRIAQEPPATREAARLLALDRGQPPGAGLRDLGIPDLPDLLRPGDLLVLNDTRVMPARLHGRRLLTGGKVEVLLIEEQAEGRLALMRTRGRPEPGEHLVFGDDDGIVLSVLGSRGDGLWLLRPLDPDSAGLEAALETLGLPPLPPYIRRRHDDPRTPQDRERYQTTFARHPGAVAAPTAGLHLTAALLDRLRQRGVATTTVTLHVGPGTFRPVTTPDLRDHAMHDEAWRLTPEAAAAVAACRARGGRVIPVGTTSVRVLESAAGPDGLPIPGAGRTDLFIHPPWRFRLVDALLTNFHAPSSTLLMLVSALAGRERVLAAYRHALQGAYRFLSYGDAMFIA